MQHFSSTFCGNILTLGNDFWLHNGNTTDMNGGVLLEYLKFEREIMVLMSSSEEKVSDGLCVTWEAWNLVGREGRGMCQELSGRKIQSIRPFSLLFLNVSPLFSLPICPSLPENHSWLSVADEMKFLHMMPPIFAPLVARPSISVLGAQSASRNFLHFSYPNPLRKIDNAADKVLKIDPFWILWGQ